MSRLKKRSLKGVVESLIRYEVNEILVRVDFYN